MVRTLVKNKVFVRMFQILFLIPVLYVSYKTFAVNILAIIQTRANIAEVASARKIKGLSKPDERILRLDYSYPVMMYYADRITEYHTTIDGGLTASIENNHISWVVGKNDQVRQFLDYYQHTPRKIIPSGEETIVQL
jgi:hypothetical protein